MKNSIDLVESDTSSISISTYSNLSNQSNSNSKNLNLNDLTSPQIKSPRHKLNRRSPSTYHLKNQSELNLFEKIVSQASMDESVYQLKDSSTDRGPMPRASLLMEVSSMVSRSC